MLNLFHFAKILSGYIFQFGNIALVIFFPISTYGKLVVIMSIAQLSFSITSGVTSGAMNVLGSRQFSKRASCNETYLYRLTIILIVFSVFFLLLKMLGGWFDIEVLAGQSLYLILLLSLSYIFYEAGCNMLYPTSKFKIQSYIELFAASCFLVFVLSIVNSIQDFIFGYLFISFVIFLFSVALLVYFFGGQPFKYTFSGLSQFASYSIWQSLSVISIYVVNYGSNYILLINNMSDISVGHVNFTLRLFFGMSAIFALIVIVMPRLVLNGSVKLETINYFSAKVILALIFLYSIAAVVFYFGLNYLEKADYLKSIKYMILMLPAFLAMAYINIVNTFLSNTESYRYAQFIILGQAVLLVVTMSFLIPFLAEYGVFISYTLSYIIFAFVVYYSLRRQVCKSDLM